MSVDQLFILVLGVGGVALAMSPSRQLQAYGVLVVLCAQPFWFYSAYTAGQWGVVLLAFWFTFCHAKGIWNHRHE